MSTVTSHPDQESSNTHRRKALARDYSTNFDDHGHSIVVREPYKPPGPSTHPNHEVTHRKHGRAFYFSDMLLYEENRKLFSEIH